MRRVLTLLVVCSILLFATGCSESSAGSAASDSPNTKTELQDIYSDELVNVSFVEKKNSAVDGMFEFYLYIENKSDQQITVYLKDAFMNDTMFMVGSGVPCDILPYKNRTHGFFGKYESTGINGAEEINKIGFSIRIAGENLQPLKTIEQIEINF